MEIVFRHDEAESAKYTITMTLPESVPDSQTSQIEEALKNSASSDFDNVSVTKTSDREITAEMDAKRKLLKESGKNSYDEIKKYVTETGGLTCK